MPVSTHSGPSQICLSNMTEDSDPSMGLAFSSAITPERVADMKSIEDAKAVTYLIYRINAEPETFGRSW
jgi:hypothetical protein